MQVPDYERALTLFVRSLKLKHQDPNALAGAGQAAFELGQYKTSEHYLKSALAANPSDGTSAQLLQTAHLVMQMDPYNMRLSASQRTGNAKDAVKSAAERLSACVSNTPAANRDLSGLQTLNATLSQLQPKLRRSALDSDTVDETMSVVFDIERQTKTICGPPSGKDLALLLIAREQEGN